MYRRLVLYSARRSYHDKPSNGPDLRVKLANKRVTNELERRSAAEWTPRITQSGPKARFEPFPYAITEENKLEVLKKVVSPLAILPYEEQLKSKASDCRMFLRQFAQQLYKLNTPIRLDVRKLPCHVNDIVEAPLLYHYRNKDDFGIWTGIDGKTSTVGYMAFPIKKHGDTIAVAPNGSVLIKEETIKLVDIVQEFIRFHAKLPVCFSLGVEGGWRRVSIRNNTEGDLMLITSLSPTTIALKEIQDERERLKEFICDRSEKAGLKLKSLYFQPCPNSLCSHTEVPYELLHGERTIIETFNQIQIAIGPETIIPSSTGGGEILFQTLLKTIEESFGFNSSSTKKPVIININCASGLTALNLTDIAHKVVGIDRRDQMIDEAKFNAKSNQVEKKCEFACADVEIILEKVLEKYRAIDVLMVGVLDHNGLSKNVVNLLLHCTSIKKLVLISYNLHLARVNSTLLALCTRMSDTSPPPFAPILVTPVDTYPHCKNYDTIIVLERLPQ